jgi:hypothetical protein
MNDDNGILKILDIAVIITLIGAILYTAGWSFAYYYFDYFNVGLLTLEIPREYFFVYSTWVLQDNFYHAALAYGIFILFLVLPLLTGRFHWLLLLLFFVFVPLLFYGSYSVGKESAEKRFYAQRQNDYPSYARVKVWLKTTGEITDNTEAEKIKDLQQGCYRLLLQNKDKIFLFYTLPKVSPADLPLTIIPLSEVENIKILPHYQSCKGDI